NGRNGNAATGNLAAIFLAAMVDRCFKYRLPLALLLAVLNCVPALARNVECPAVWPGDSSKSKVKGTAYIDAQTQPPWEESKHGTRVEGVVYGEYVDLQCLYANWRTLFFQLHDEEKECHEIILSFATKPPRRWRRQT
ncbi:MAG: hypothetical protein WCC90_19570, partial [Methylocella sp.]